MHILMVNDYFGFSAGAFAVAWEMSQELMNQGHKVSFLCAVEEGEEGLETIEGREVVRLKVRTHYRLRPLVTIHRPGLVSRALRWVEELSPDLVHGHVLHLHLSFGLVRALDKKGLPVVLTAHDTGIFCPTKYVCRPPESPNSPARAKDCALLPFAESDKPFVRAAVFRGMKELRNPVVLRTALAATEDTESQVRVQAVGVIGYLKSDEALPALILATRDDAAEVRRAAVGALARMT